MSDGFPEGRAIVYCEGAFGTPNGKTAHGLVRFTRRYSVVGVIDSRHAGRDAGELLDGRPAGIPVHAGVCDAVAAAAASDSPATHFVVGLAPDGGRLSAVARRDVETAIAAGLSVDAGLHDWLGDDPRLVALAAERGVRLRDIRKPPPRESLHFFEGKIAEVDSLVVALLGTDSAVGKRTTAWRLHDALNEAGLPCQFVGTGQTAWLQGARYGFVLDSLINDFIAGEIEHAVHQAWSENWPEVIVVEGQGSLMNPAYPGGFEILAAARPAAVVMQHAPARREYDGFPGFAMHPLARQIEAVRVVSDRPVVAVTVNHEDMTPEQTRHACAEITRETGLPACDVLLDGAGPVVEALRPLLAARRRERR